MARVAAPLFLSPLLWSSLLWAQEGVEPRRFVPAAAQLVCRIQAPASWSEAFAKTRLARLFDKPTLTEFLAPIQQALKHEIGESDYFQEMTPEVVNGLFEDYRGELLIALQSEPTTVADQPTESAAMITLTPGGDYELRNLLEAFRRADGTVVPDADLRSITIGEHSFNVTPGPIGNTQVELIEEHLVMFAGTAIEELGPQMLANSDRADVLPAAAPLAFRISLDAIIEQAIVEMESDPSRLPSLKPGNVREFVDLVGLRWETLEGSLSADGEDTVIEFSIQTKNSTGIEPGAAPERPRLMRYIPAAVPSFAVGSIAPLAMFQTFQNVAPLLADQEFTVEDLESMFEQRTKVRLKEDLLDHLGTEYLILGGLADILEDVADMLASGSRDPNRFLSGVCCGIALHDSKAFARSVDSILQASGLKQARRSNAYGDHTVYLLNFGGVVTFEYAITPDLFLIVFGNRGNGSEYLRSALDTIDDGPALSDEVEQRIGRMPTGWDSITVQSLADLLSAGVEIVIAQGNQGGSSSLSQNQIDSFRGFLSELREANLHQVFMATYPTKRGHRREIRW